MRVVYSTLIVASFLLAVPAYGVWRALHCAAWPFEAWVLMHARLASRWKRLRDATPPARSANDRPRGKA